MCVHAHPDDESSKGAATMAKYVDEGHDVLVVSCTGGERGDVLNPRLKDDAHILRDLAQVRRDEISMQLTEGYAVSPAARVSGFYLSHAQAEYFNVGRIGEDQLKDYAHRAGREEEELRRSLGSALG